MNVLTFPILRLLADGKFHSGEDLARHFGVTRATVWNALQQAEQLGVRLYSVRGRGYCLPEPVRFVEAERVLAMLGVQRDKFALEIHDQIDSTNSYLMRQAAAGARSGTCAVALLQTDGRGRRGRSWQARLGDSLTFSVLWRFDGGAGALSGLSLAVGVALVRALHAVGADGIALKWPNDVLHDGGKLAGILIELQGDMDGPSAAVIGIGLNLRLSADLRRGIDQPAAGLRDILTDLPPADELLGVLLYHLAEVLQAFERDGFSALREEWAASHAYHAQPVRMLMPDGRAIEGTVADVAADGGLLLDVGGSVQRFSAGEISMRGVA
jgi:BirA family biotin operon repressor/biotin-[acetyl-CoA-carboxylase] ligase